MKKSGFWIYISLIIVSCGQKENNYNKALKMLTDKKYDKSIEYLNKVLVDDSNNTEAYILRGKVKYEIHDTAGCRMDIQKAALLGNKNASEMYNQYFKPVVSDEYRARIQAANQLLHDSHKIPDGYYNLGNVFFDKRDYEKAIELYSKAISIDKKYSAAYYNRGVCYINIHQEMKGCEDIEVSAKLGYQLAIEAMPQCQKVLH